MRKGSSDDPALVFFPQNTQLLQAGTGIHDGGAALDLAVREYRNTFNLSAGINGIRENGDISEFGPLSPPTPAIVLLRDDNRLFYGRETESDQIGQTAADGAG